VTSIYYIYYILEGLSLLYFVDVVMCLAFAGHMISCLALCFSWGSESSSECGGEADFVSD